MAYRVLPHGRRTADRHHHHPWLGLARNTDRILVMERGRIVQDGSHAELMAADGLYARMFHAQAAWYQREEEG